MTSLVVSLVLLFRVFCISQLAVVPYPFSFCNVVLSVRNPMLLCVHVFFYYEVITYNWGIMLFRFGIELFAFAHGTCLSGEWASLRT